MNGRHARRVLVLHLRATFGHPTTLTARRSIVSSGEHAVGREHSSFIEDLSSRRLLFDTTGLPGEAEKIITQHALHNDGACAGKRTPATNRRACNGMG